jgi:hypothetical protein
LLLLFVLLDVAAGYRPAQSRLMPSLARSPAELAHAVAGTSMAKMIGQAAGALLGGALVAFASAGTAMAAEATLFLIALACTVGIGGRSVAHGGEQSRTLRAGLSAFPGVLTDTNGWPLILASVLRTLVRGLWGSLLVVVALRMLHAGDSSLGLLQAATGLGAVVALPITAAQIGRARLALPCAAAFVVAGGTVGVVGAAPPFAAVVASLKLVAEGVGALLAPALVALGELRAALIIASLPLPVLIVAPWWRIRRPDEMAAGRGPSNRVITVTAST